MMIEVNDNTAKNLWNGLENYLQITPGAIYWDGKRTTEAEMIIKIEGFLKSEYRLKNTTEFQERLANLLKKANDAHLSAKAVSNIFSDFQRDLKKYVKWSIEDLVMEYGQTQSGKHILDQYGIYLKGIWAIFSVDGEMLKVVESTLYDALKYAVQNEKFYTLENNNFVFGSITSFTPLKIKY